MPRRVRRPTGQAFFRIATFVLLVVVFAQGHEVLVPLALAVIMAFALTPLVHALERRLGRGLALVLVVLLSLSAVTAFGYLLDRQIVDLSAQMTRYTESMRRKVAALRLHTPGFVGEISRTADTLARELDEQVEARRNAQPVRLVEGETSLMARLGAALAPIAAPLAKTLVVIVLVIFMLARREDIRDRIIRVVGRHRVTLTTRTLDDAGERIGGYLLTQTAINTAFGVLVTIGLTIIGTPYAALWGFVAAVLRFIPFVGTLLAMSLPALVGFAVFDGWGRALETVGLFLGLDALFAYLIEPLAVGHRIGISSLALVVMAMFWTWLWGPAGLVLSTPLTVCLVAVAKQVPELEFLSVLLGDQPPLEAELSFYQRLLAGDEDEAGDIVEAALAGQRAPEAADDVVLPAVVMAARDRSRGLLAEADYATVLRTVRRIFQRSFELPRDPRGAAAGEPAGAPAFASRRVLGVPAGGAADELALEILRRSLPPTKLAITALGAGSLASEAAAISAEAGTHLVLVTALPPGGLGHARYLCRRLRSADPAVPILVLRPTGASSESFASDAARLLRDGATAVVPTLEEARARFAQLVTLITRA
jgi:predicted PurR-regulated permease PerM